MHVIRIALAITLFFCAAVVLFSGCASVQPRTYPDIQSEETYAASYDRIWEPVSAFLVDKNIGIDTLEMESGKIVSQEVNVPYRGFLYESEYCDCGTLSGLHVFRQILGKFEIFIQELEENRISVRIQAQYRAAKWLSDDFLEWVTCPSKGYLERSLFGWLGAQFEVYDEKKHKKPVIQKEGEKPAEGEEQEKGDEEQDEQDENKQREEPVQEEKREQDLVMKEN